MPLPYAPAPSASAESALLRSPATPAGLHRSSAGASSLASSDAVRSPATQAGLHHPSAGASSLASSDAVRPRQADDAVADPDPAPAGDELIEQELLIEEISIDGMCGVY